MPYDETAIPPSAGRITFACGDPGLEAGFRWAREQALRRARHQGPAGPWYEAALPGRDAFCMRDVSHHAAGAHFLGLDAHNKNMLLRFARSMAESRDYCCFWEITGDGGPAAVDYTDDRDFWYNLPANFDLLDACWRMYCLTGDEDYREDPDFQSFYDRTVREYIAVWDHDGDGIPDRDFDGVRRRGIPSYDEQKGMEGMAVAADLIAAQYRGFLSYGKLRAASGPESAGWEEKASRLAELLASKWYDRENRRFYGAMDRDGGMFPALGSPHLLAYFDAVRDEAQRAAPKVFPRFQPIFISLTNVNESFSGISKLSSCMSGISYLLSGTAVGPVVGAGSGVVVGSAAGVGSAAVVGSAARVGSAGDVGSAGVFSPSPPQPVNAPAESTPASSRASILSLRLFLFPPPVFSRVFLTSEAPLISIPLFILSPLLSSALPGRCRQPPRAAAARTAFCRFRSGPAAPDVCRSPSALPYA